VAAIAAAISAMLVPRAVRALSGARHSDDEMPHAELGLLAAGTLVGDEPE
jgi:hypothetical protein